MDLLRVERELKNRLPYAYKWGRKQSNSWDSATNFIYTTYSFSKLIEKTDTLSQELKDYAFNRWYNFWSAMAIEDIFTSHSNVVAHVNAYDKLVDFSIDNIPFDHKTSVFPKGFNGSYNYARENEKELIEWLYKNQSQEGRKHLKNRLFVIMYDENGQHWKMKSEIMLVKKEIDTYVDNFSKSKLYELDFSNGKIYAGLLWVTKGINIK